jgi:toxin ParE1/3/4
MPRTVRWSRTALLQLAAIRDQIAKDEPKAAVKLALRLRNSTNSLATFPLSGRAGLTPATRQWVIPGTQYIATYSSSEEEIYVLSLHHGMTNWTAATGKPK